MLIFTTEASFTKSPVRTTCKQVVTDFACAIIAH